MNTQINILGKEHPNRNQLEIEPLNKLPWKLNTVPRKFTNKLHKTQSVTTQNTSYNDKHTIWTSKQYSYISYIRHENHRFNRVKQKVKSQTLLGFLKTSIPIQSSFWSPSLSSTSELHCNEETKTIEIEKPNWT